MAYDSRCSKSGLYWAWLEGKAAEEAAAAGADLRAGWESIYESEPTDQVLDKDKSADLWRHSCAVTGASWPAANQPKSPCPTLKVVGAVTQAMNAKEEAKRTLEGMAPGEGSSGVTGIGGKVLGSTSYVVDSVAGNTIGRAAKLAQDRLLGGVPTEAVEGSYQDTLEKGAASDTLAVAEEAELQQEETELDVRIGSVLSEGLPVPDAEIQSS